MMSLNQFMHPNNIYRHKPNYGEMAIQFPEFAKFVKQDVSGQTVIDFDDSEAVRCLTTTLLKKDFDLDVEIPSDRLIPTVPQRLNYVLWVGDLVGRLSQGGICDGKSVCCVDIGTGASSIFPLLACTINKHWNFVASDVDHVNLEYAQRNVMRNNLSERIKIVTGKEETLLTDIICHASQPIHLTMCNPPFFSDFHDKNKNGQQDSSMSSNESHTQTHSNRHKKSTSNTCCSKEASFDGGEVEFVSRMIKESLELKTKVAIYSTMLGKSKSFNILRDILEGHRKNGLLFSHANTQFCQGKTKRWGLAWTFVDKLDLSETPSIKYVKPKPALSYVIPKLKGVDKYNLQIVTDKIKRILSDELQVDHFEVVRESKQSVEIWIRSNRNTWSHQRRKRREEAKLKESGVDTSSESVSEMDGNHVSEKRRLDESVGEESEMSVEEEQESVKKRKESVTYQASDTHLLHCSLTVKRIQYSLILMMQAKENCRDKESTYQLFQFLRNKLV